MTNATTSTPPPMPPPAMPWALIAAGCLAMFAASSSGATRSPFLIQMAQDLGTSVPLMANLMAAVATAWGVSSVLAGAGSDRWGRRPFLVGGPVAVALCMLGVARSEGFAGVMAWGAAGGACAGAFTGVIMAEVSARTWDRQRGRALGWVMAGQSLTLLVGVPVAAFIGVLIGWRGVHLAVGLLCLLAAAALLLTTRRPVDGQRRPGAARPSYRAALTGPVLRLLTMGVAERICFGLTSVYFATFLQTTYGLSLGAVALPLAIFALGNILGTILGGQLADRLPNRLHNFAAAMFGCALLALPLFGWTPGLVGTVMLAFGYVLLNAIARPSLMAALANVPDAVRGTVLGLNVTSASLGWLGAAALGGWMLAEFGFTGFGPLAAGVGCLGGVLAVTGPSNGTSSG